MSLYAVRSKKRRSAGLLAAVSLLLAPWPHPATASDPAASTIDFELEEIDGVIAAAHFQTALGMLAATRASLDSLGGHRVWPARCARLELLAATAEIALGRRSSASRSMARALEADAQLRLDPNQYSPKLVELLEAARRASPPARNVE